MGARGFVLAWFAAGLLACASPLDASAPAWRRVAAQGPEARWGHAAVYDPARDRMIVFGGQTAHGERADMWAFDLAHETWSQLITASGPAPRVNPAMVLDAARDRVIVVGGRTGLATMFDDAWSLDLASLAWTELPHGPPGRQRMHAATDGTHAYFYGGEGLFSVLGDLWSYDLASDTWQSLPNDGDGPGARTCGAFAVIDGALVMTGGHNVQLPLDGTFRYDLVAHRWSHVTTTGGTAAGAHWAYATDGACGAIVLAGGDHLDNYDTALTDVLSLRATPGFARLHASALPPVHDHATLVIDPVRRNAILFGGTVGDGQSYLGDTWIHPLASCP